MKKQIAINLLNDLLDNLLITEEQKDAIKLICELFYNAGAGDELNKLKDKLI